DDVPAGALRFDDMAGEAGAGTQPDQRPGLLAIAPHQVQLAVAVEVAGRLQGVLGAQGVGAGRAAGCAIHRPPAEVVLPVLLLPPEDVRLAVTGDVAGTGHIPARAIGRQGVAGEGAALAEPDEHPRLLPVPPDQIRLAVAIEVTDRLEGVLYAQGIRAGSATGQAVHRPPAEVFLGGDVLAPEDVGLAVTVDVAGTDHIPVRSVGGDGMPGKAGRRTQPDDDAGLALLPPNQVGETVAVEVPGGAQDI